MLPPLWPRDVNLGPEGKIDRLLEHQGQPWS
jgi:hypothetical protein